MSVKVGAAHVVNGQIAPAGDLVSLLGGGENATFASLLDLGGNEPGATDRVDGSRERQGNRPREKERDERHPPASGDSRPGTTSSPLGSQTLPSVGGASWRLDPGDFRAVGDAKDKSSLQSVAEASGGGFPPHMRPPIDVRTVDEPASSQARGYDENSLGTPLFPDPSDPELMDPPKAATGKKPDVTITKVNPAPNDQDTVSEATESSSAAPAVVQPTGGLADNGASAAIPRGEADSRLVGISVVQRHAAALNHGVKSEGGRRDPVTSAGERWNGLPVEDGRGQVRSSAPSQGVVDAASSSTAGGRGQGGGADTHRNLFDTKEVASEGRVPSTQTLQINPAGAQSQGASIHGHSVLMNSNHPESVRDSTPTAQLRELTSPQTEDASARLLGGALRGDLRVGVHTEAFGRVTIQTNTQGGQLSAQLSLENPKEGATLAAHLPGVEQKIVQQHGLNASVRLVGGFDGTAGGGSRGSDQSASRKEPERYQGNVAVRTEGIGHDSSIEGRGVETALLGSKYLVSSRLDVTV